MSIELREGATIAFWYTHGTVQEQGQDWMAHAGYETIDGKRKLVLTYRFRYYADTGKEDPFNDKDKKNWYRVVSNKEASVDDEKILFEAVKTMLELITIRFNTKSYDAIFLSDFKSWTEFLTYLTSKPYMHMKAENSHEC